MTGLRLARRMFSVDPSDRSMQPPWAIGMSGPDQSGVPPRARPGTELELAESGPGGLTGLVGHEKRQEPGPTAIIQCRRDTSV